MLKILISCKFPYDNTYLKIFHLDFLVRPQKHHPKLFFYEALPLRIKIYSNWGDVIGAGGEAQKGLKAEWYFAYSLVILSLPCFQ